MNIRLTHIDGSQPNIALMRLSHYWKSQGANVYFTNSVEKDLFEPEYYKVYGSSIFEFSQVRRDKLINCFPNAIIGGTGTKNTETLEDMFGNIEKMDYSIYPDFQHSIGFSQRGCRLKCKFCVVPRKEGNVFEVNSLKNIYRGSPYPKNLLLLDNDFFGQEHWKEKAIEAIENDYNLCLVQGINARLITDEQAEYLSKMKLYDFKFGHKRIYTAWDIPEQEKIFFNGIDRLLKHGIKASNIFVYMIEGFFNEDINISLERFKKVNSLGLKPYPLVFNPMIPEHKIFRQFQRWVVRRYYEICSWEDYLSKNFNKEELTLELFS